MVPPVAPVVSVWGVWDGEDLVGVYAQEQVARADAAVLRRDAVQAGVRASTIDCMPVPVFSAAQHARRGVAGSGGGVTADADVVPAGYAELLEQLKVRVQATQVRAARAANSEVLGLYWSVGGDILDRQDRLGWGGKVVDRLAGDLRAAFPDQRGWSASNLQYVRGFAAAWPDLEISPQAVGKLPWGHVRALLDRLDTQEDRDWYAAESVGQGWSRAVFEYQIGTGLHRRVGAAPSNFADQLPRRTRTWPSSWSGTRTCSSTCPCWWWTCCWSTSSSCARSGTGAAGPGSRVIEVVRAGRTWSARQPSGRANSCTNRECRSTRVPTADGRRP